MVFHLNKFLVLILLNSTFLQYLIAFVLVFPPSPFSKMTTTGSEEQVILVALGGASSSGKTTVAKALKLLIPSSVLIHLDDFYFTDSDIPIDPETGYQNWDCRKP